MPYQQVFVAWKVEMPRARFRQQRGVIVAALRIALLVQWYRQQRVRGDPVAPVRPGQQQPKRLGQPRVPVIKMCNSAASFQ